MSDYNPDKWVVVKIIGKDTPPVHKVFACWYGGYLDGDSWKLNSGITARLQRMLIIISLMVPVVLAMLVVKDRMALICMVREY
jgi:hypothetical protein